MGTRRWIVAVGTCAAALAAGCHDPNQVRQLEARAVLSATDLDFGDVPVGEWRDGNLTIRNAGFVPFSAREAVLLGGNPSFVAELVDGDKKIAPGEARPVVVRFHPLREGPQEDGLRVELDADNAPRGTVRLRGVGMPTPIGVRPTSLDFQTLEIDSDRVLGFEVTNPADLPLEIRVAGSSAEPFSTDAITIPPYSTRRINARYAPHLARRDAATFEIRSCPSCTPAAVAASGRAVPSAFVFEPAPVPFADIPVHETTLSRTRARNVTWRPVEISRLTTSDYSFQPLTAVANTTVAPGAAVEVDIEFAARFAGPAVGTMNVDYRSDKARVSQVVLDARGGRPQLAITPVSIDFGKTDVGAKLARTVRLSNAGTNGDLHFFAIRFDGPQADQFGASEPFRGTRRYPWDPASTWPLLQQPAGGIAIAPGADFVDVQIYFGPTAPGSYQATLTFLSDDLFSPERTVVVTGEATATGPCTFEVLPSPVLDFGNVTAGRGAVLGFRFSNTGGNDCAVKDIHLSNDAGGAFFMPGGPIPGGVVPPASAFSAMIAFKTPNEGSYQGELSITVNSLATPTFRLPIRALALSSCLTAAPHYLDFGAIRQECSARPLTTYVSNQCPSDVVVDSVEIGPGTADQFLISSVPRMPITLSPAAGFEIQISYLHDVRGQFYSPLYIWAAGEPAPYMVPLLGEDNPEGVKDDRFIQGADNQLDLLFVVSNTTTMQPYQDRLRAAVPAFLSKARAEGLDLNVGVTTTGLVPRSPLCPGGADGGEAGRLFPVDNSRPRILSAGSPSAPSGVDADLQVGVCHNLVQGLETMRAALSSPLVDHADDPMTPLPDDGNLGLLRDTARLSVIFLSDEDDHSGFDPASYVQFLQAVKGPGMSHRTQAQAIVPTDPSCQTAGPPGPRFAGVATGMGGQVVNVCSADYGPLLDSVAARAAGLQRDFRLTAVPMSAADIQVSVNGIPAAAGSWSFDPATNSVVFTAAAVPSPGQVVEARYNAACGAP